MRTIEGADAIQVSIFGLLIQILCHHWSFNNQVMIVVWLLSGSVLNLVSGQVAIGNNHADLAIKVWMDVKQKYQFSAT